MPEESERGNLPDFIIAGTQKGGTEAAAANLERHEDIWLVRHCSFTGHRETQFFVHGWEMGVDWYRSHFKGDCGLLGEKSPNYLAWHEAHQRMSSVVPSAKLVILLRNPVTRAYSAYNHGRMDGWGAFGDHDFYRKHDFDPMIRDYPEVDCLVHGRYVEHLEHLLKFYPREQIHISVSERVKKDMASGYDKILAFLGSKSRGDVGYCLVHSRAYERELSKWAKEYMQEYYEPFNERLFNFLGYDIPEWKM